MTKTKKPITIAQILRLRTVSRNSNNGRSRLISSPFPPNCRIRPKRAGVEQMRAAESMQAVRVAMIAPVPGAGEGARDVDSARALFEESCTMCHELAEVEQYPLQSQQDIAALLARMVDNGLDLTEQDSATIAWYLARTYLE